MNSTASLIEKAISEAPELSLWHISDFLDYGKASNVKVVLSRLAEEGKLRRAIDGIYYRPKTVLGIEVPPSAHEIARKIASLHRWSIVPSGDTALNALGLSTQVPSEYVYSSDGPYRDYLIDGIPLHFRHKSTRFIKGMSHKTALFVEAMKALGRENVDDATIKSLAESLGEGEINQILNEAKSAPEWIYDTAMRVQEEKQWKRS